MQNYFSIQFLWVVKSLWLTSKKIPLFMRLLVLFLVCSIGLTYAADSYAQKALISIDVRNQRVEDILKEIEEQSDFDFFFNNRHVDLNRRVSVSADKSNIFSVLKEIFAGTNVKYSVLDKKIILSVEAESPQQEKVVVINGFVTDSANEPVIGASVLEKGVKGNGTITDLDGKYEDSRHPKEVTFTPNLEEDLKRRDFTINAMAYNETEGLIDIFGGLKDIEAKLIRCVGNPEERFGEDALRIMRAIRFSAQLGYEIHEDTEAAIRKLAPTLQKISAERIQVELTKLLISPHPDTLREAYDMGVTKVILPEFDAMMETPQKHKHHKYNVGEHTLHALMEIGPDKNLRYAMLLHDIGKPATLTVDEDGITHFYGHPAVGEEMARKILRRLRFDSDTVAVVTRLVRYHDYGNDVIPDLRIVRRAVNKIGEDIFPLLFPVKRADILAQSDYLRTEKLENLELWKKLYQEMLEKKQCVSLKTLAVTGRDLIAMGMKPGRELGDMLQKLLELVLEHPEQNTREQLLEKVKELSADKD